MGKIKKCNKCASGNFRIADFDKRLSAWCRDCNNWIQYIEPLPPPEHKAWMNGKRFVKKNVEYEVVEGIEKLVNDELRNVVIFKNIETGENYEMTEEEFFDKVDLMNKA